MTLFFDIWTPVGFVLAADVRISNDPAKDKAHKIDFSERPEPIAIAVCGDYPEVCLAIFKQAVASTDGTLGKVAHYFAERWTKRFSPEKDDAPDSAVHLVGFSSLEAHGVPQMWYWTTGFPRERTPASQLADDLASFRNQIPNNNHIAYDKVGARTLVEEQRGVGEFLRKSIVSTWNGDPDLWGTANSTATAFGELIQRNGRGISLEGLGRVAKHAVEFISLVANLSIENCTVGLSLDNQCDAIAIRKEGITAISRSSDLDERASKV